jgi:hypothetical protein
VPISIQLPIDSTSQFYGIKGIKVSNIFNTIACFESIDRFIIQQIIEHLHRKMISPTTMTLACGATFTGVGQN